jgi:hypothetical protein
MGAPFELNIKALSYAVILATGDQHMVFFRRDAHNDQEVQEKL